MQCKAITKSGNPCKAHAMANGYCYRHNPDIALKDKLQASRRGGSKLDLSSLAETARPIDTTTLQGLLQALNNNADDLRQGKIDPRTSNAFVQNALAVIELKKTIDLDNRITALEEKIKRWGYN